MKCYLIAGKKRSGKDYCTSIFKNIEPISHISFAGELKEIACRLLNLSLEELDNLKNEKKSVKVNKKIFNSKLIEEAFNTNSKYNLNVSGEVIKREAITLKIPCITENDNYIFDVRVFLQYYASIWKDIFGESIWADIASLKGNDYIIISDFRFPIEYEAIKKKYEVTTIKVIGKNQYDIDEYDLHPSETALNDFKFDYIINNTVYDDLSLLYQIKAILKGK